MKSDRRRVPALASVYTSYLTAIQCGSRAEALRVGHTALKDGVDIYDLYEHVLQPAMYTVGDLWARGDLNVAREHIATAITRGVMEELARAQAHLAEGNRRVIATCIGGELHDLGIRMVADCFEIQGWETLFLGANVPTEDIIMLTADFRPALLAVSITIGSHATQVRDLINATRRTISDPNLKVLVGGQPFLRLPELWRQVGADGMATTPREALHWAETYCIGTQMSGPRIVA